MTAGVAWPGRFSRLDDGWLCLSCTENQHIRGLYLNRSILVFFRAHELMSKFNASLVFVCNTCVSRFRRAANRRAVSVPRSPQNQLPAGARRRWCYSGGMDATARVHRGPCAAAAWPLSGRAQQSLPTIGYLHALSREINRDFLNAFQSGLSDGGFVEGKNVAIEYRCAEAHFDRLPELANGLVAKRVNLIATAGGSASAIAAKAATSTTPIVFMNRGRAKNRRSRRRPKPGWCLWRATKPRTTAIRMNLDDAPPGMPRARTWTRGRAQASGAFGPGYRVQDPRQGGNQAAQGALLS